MTDDQQRDQQRDAVNDGLRALARANRVTVARTTTRAALNTAIRRAAGREPDDGTDSPGPYPWRSLSLRRDDAEKYESDIAED
jgi:hypothetical protein